MNNLIQKVKIVAVCLLGAIIITSCTKEEENPNQATAICDHVSISVRNSLDGDISDLSIDGIEVGDLAQGAISEEICFDRIAVQGDVVILYLTGTFDDEFKDGYINFCGTGMTITTNGSYNIDITTVLDNFFLYTGF